MTVPFILDTDTAQDDCVAILLGLLDAEADLRGITIVAGNVPFEQQVHNAHLTMSVAGRLAEIPIFCGSRKPLVRDWVSAQDVHGDGVGGLTLDLDVLPTQTEDGVDALLRITAEEPGDINIVATGPLTNIALAVMRDPHFAERVKHLFIMGGSNNARGNITAAAEFNFYVDPDAAKIVLSSGFDVSLIPWEPLAVRDALFSRDQLDQIVSQNTPLASFFYKVCDTTLQFDESVGICGSTHPDSLAVAVMLHPEIVIRSGMYAVDVEAESDLTRGYAPMSWGVHGLSPNARVIEEVDSKAFYGIIMELISTRTKPSSNILGLQNIAKSFKR